MILSLAAGSDDQVSLVQGLHHFLRLVETDVVEVGVGDHTLYIRYRKEKNKESPSVNKHILRTKTSNWGCLNEILRNALKLTRPLLFLFELLVQFLVFGLFVEVVVGVLGELPLVRLVHQVGRAAREVHAELLDVDLHDATVNRHPNLKAEHEKQHGGSRR